jgi:hypothetical protein
MGSSREPFFEPSLLGLGLQVDGGRKCFNCEVLNGNTRFCSRDDQTLDGHRVSSAIREKIQSDEITCVPRGNELDGKRKQRYDCSIFGRVCMRIDPLYMLTRAGCDA